MVRDTTFSVIFISFVWALLFMRKLESSSKHRPNIAFVSTRARFSIIHFFEKKPFSVSIQLNSQVYVLIWSIQRQNIHFYLIRVAFV